MFIGTLKSPILDLTTGTTEEDDFMGHLITTPDTLGRACAELKNSSVIAFDTEFIRETTYYPNLALIQLATDAQVFLVDPLAFDKASLAPMRDVLTDPKILKVLHSAQADEECLWTTYGYLAEPIFDTSIAASLLGMGDQVGLGKLLETAIGVTIAKGHSRTNWLQRPLPAELLNYAREDVAHLVAAYQKLKEGLTTHKRLDWAMELSAAWAKPERFTPNFVDMAEKVGRRKRMDAKALSLLTRLMEWRERVAIALNVPRRRVADEQALIDIAVTRPAAEAHLHSFRGIHKAVMAKHTGEILALCRDTSVMPELTKVRPEKTRESTDEKLAIELFQYAVKVLAIRHRLSAKHLLDRDTAEKILFGKFSGPDEWVTASILSQDIHAMIGEELWAFVTGKMSLSLSGGKIILK